MNCLPDNELIELAFARLGQRPRTPASQKTNSHVQNCPVCSARLAQYLTMLKGVRKCLGETPTANTECLEDEVIAAYLDDELDTGAREEAEAHFASCQECLRQLRELAQCVQDVEESPAEQALMFAVEIGKRALRMLAAPDDGFLLGEQTPVPSLAPGDTNHVLCWTQRVGELELWLRLIRVDDAHVTLRIAGAPDGPSLAGVRFNLRSDNEIVQSELIPREGAFTLHSLEIGPYDVELCLPKPVVLHLNLRKEVLSSQED